MDTQVRNNQILELHLKVLEDLLQGEDFDTIKEKHGDEIERTHYLQVANDQLLTFHEGKLIGAYPISPAPTRYKVTVDDVGTGYAMCAIDALGVAFTFQKPTTIKLVPVDSDTPMTIKVDPAGKMSSKDFYVGYKKMAGITNAALQQCPSINFYKSKENIPEGLVPLEAEMALLAAEERFSQVAIMNCIAGVCR